MRISNSPIFIVTLVAAGAISIILILSTSDALKQPTLPENPYPSIEIEMPKTTYQVGERLDFTIHTYGICASPNVSIWRHTGNGESMLVYQYVAGPIRCPAPQSPGQPYLKWKADQLIQRISDENFGGDGNSVIMINAAFPLKKAGNYSISASLPDRSKDLSREFSVIDTDGNVIPPVRMNLTSLKAYTTSNELIGNVVPDMLIKKGEQVLFNATFANTSPAVEMRAAADFVLMLGIRDGGEMPRPDDFSIVTGADMIIPPGGSISVERSWLPEQVGNYTVVVFSLRKTDLNNTMIMAPVAAIPIRVVE